MSNLIKRVQYLFKFCNYKDKNWVKVLVGMHRLSKSTILKMFTDELRANGASDKQIVFINF